MKILNNLQVKKTVMKSAAVLEYIQFLKIRTWHWFAFKESASQLVVVTVIVRTEEINMFHAKQDPACMSSRFCAPKAEIFRLQKLCQHS